MWEQVKMKHMLPVWCETIGELLNGAFEEALEGKRR